MNIITIHIHLRLISANKSKQLYVACFLFYHDYYFNDLAHISPFSSSLSPAAMAIGQP